MDVVGPGHLCVGVIGLEGFEHDLKFELGVDLEMCHRHAITHSMCSWIG